MELIVAALFSGLERQSLVLPSQDIIARVLSRMAAAASEGGAPTSFTRGAFNAVCQAMLEEAAITRFAICDSRIATTAKRAVGSLGGG